MLKTTMLMGLGLVVTVLLAGLVFHWTINRVYVPDERAIIAALGILLRAPTKNVETSAQRFGDAEGQGLDAKEASRNECTPNDT